MKDKFYRSILVLIALVAATFVSCNQINKKSSNEVDEGTIKGNVYESKEIGWKIGIPKDWTVVSLKESEESDNEGKEIIEKSTGVSMDMSQLNNLISFQKDEFNSFSATSEPFSGTEEEYEKNNKYVYDILYKTFVDQGVRVDTSSGIEMIQGLKFSAFYTAIFDADSNLVLNQILYSRLINGYDFGVNINFTNNQSKETLLNAFKRSRFVNN